MDSRITTGKDGQRTLTVYYDDDFNAAIAKAKDRHSVNDVPIWIIALPADLKGHNV